VSRVGRMPVEIPGGVQVDIKGSNVHVKGPKGEMKRTFSPLIGIKMDGNLITLERKSDAPAERALHGTTRAVLANMVYGVSTGFEVVLEVEGVGYRAEMNGKNLVLNVGYSHPVQMEPPEGISFEADAKTRQIKRVNASVARLVRLGKEPSVLWLTKVGQLHVFVGMLGFERMLPVPQSAHD
jgi:large subunit ribosomal protein L6